MVSFKISFDSSFELASHNVDSFLFAGCSLNYRFFKCIVAYTQSFILKISDRLAHLNNFLSQIPAHSQRHRFPLINCRLNIISSVCHNFLKYFSNKILFFEDHPIVFNCILKKFMDSGATLNSQHICHMLGLVSDHRHSEFFFDKIGMD